MAHKLTVLDELVEKGTKLVLELEQIDGDRKLSYGAFLAESLKVGECDQKRIAVVKKIIFEKQGTEAIQIYLRKLSKVLAEPHYVQPFPDPSRPVRIFGNEELPAQMAQFQILAGELQALGVMITQERFGDGAFGRVEDLAKHQLTAARIRMCGCWTVNPGLAAQVSSVCYRSPSQTQTGKTFQESCLK